MTKGGLRVIAFLAVLAVPSIANAQGGSGNDAKLKAGIALVKSRDYDKAATHLARLYASTKDARALYWMGRAQQENGRLADALRAYKQYMKEAPPNATEPRSIDVLGQIQTLSMQVAVVTVTATEGAVITVDEVEVGKAPLAEGVYVDPGKHTIAATVGVRTASKQVDLAVESRSTLDLVVQEAPRPAAPAEGPAPAAAQPPTMVVPPPSSKSSSSGSGGDAITIGGLGVATLLAVGSVYFTVKAAGTASEFDAKKGELGVTRGELDGLQSDTRLQAGLGLGLGLAAIGAAGVTLFVLRKPHAEAARSSRIMVTGQGFALAGSF